MHRDITHSPDPANLQQQDADDSAFKTQRLDHDQGCMISAGHDKYVRMLRFSSAVSSRDRMCFKT